MIVPDIPFGPLSISSLLTSLGLVGTVGVFIWKSGQWANQREEEKKAADLALANHKTEVKNHLDGYGHRLVGVEKEQLEARGRDAIMSENINRTLGAHESLIRIIGEARGSTVQCREDTQALGEKIERKMDDHSKIQTDNHLDLSTRLARVEHELVLMRDKK